MMSMVSHGIPDTFGYNEHEDIALYSQALDSARRPYHLAHIKSQSRENNVLKVTASDKILNSSSEDVTDDPFSCNFDEILDLEESQFMSHASHSSPSQHDNSLPECSDFSLVLANHDINNLESKPDIKVKCNSASNEKLSSMDDNSEKSDSGQSAVTCKDIAVNNNEESNIPVSKHLKFFTIEFSDEHRCIKNMAQCIQEPQIMNEHEFSGDIQSCEHELIHKLSHTLPYDDKQYKPCLQYKAVSKNSEYSTLQPKKNSYEPASNVLRKDTVCDSKVLSSTVGVEHAGNASGVEILSDGVTGPFQSHKSNNEANFIGSCKSVDTCFLYQQNKSHKTSYVSVSTDSKATKTISDSSSSRWCQRDGDFDAGEGIPVKREVSSCLKNVDKTIETTDQLKHCEVSSTTTSETIHRVQSAKFPGILNINQPQESSTMNYELIIQEHGLRGCACDEQDMNLNPQSNSNADIQSIELDSSIDGVEIPHMTQENRLGVQRGWIPVSHKLAMFENSCVAENDRNNGKPTLNTGDIMHRLIEKNTDSKDTGIAQDLKGINIRPELTTMGITSIPPSGSISHIGVMAPLPSPVSPVDGNFSLPLPGQLTSTHALNSIGMSKNKVTFEQRREKELDDILHVLQATVQKMEEDCYDSQCNTWRACSQSANLMDPRSHCFSLTSDAISEDDLPPLPPPPPMEDLSSFDSNASSSSQIKSQSPTSNVISPTFKASANFSVWTPGGGTSKDGENVRGNSKAAAGTAPTRFRSVSRPVLKKSDKSPAASTVSTSYHFPGKGLSEPAGNVKVTLKHELPQGAVYETRTVDGDMVHTDTYYPAPGESTVLERTKKTTVIKAERHHGMGPTSDSGVPIALRSTVDNPKAWYKNMFKQIHKFDQEDEEHSSDNVETKPEMHDTPAVSSIQYKPKKLGRITDYTPSEPYVVESKPNGERIPPSSTSYKPSSYQYNAPGTVKSQEEPVHSTEYAVKDYALADHVVMEPKHIVTMHPSKPKETKQPESKRLTAQAKFDFNAQSNKQLGFKKGQIIIITKEINKDWYEGETADRKSSGMFPVAYVKVLSQTERKSQKKGEAKAKFDFNGTNPKQLSIKKGDSIQLLEKVDKNWYKAAIGQKTGIVPSNYVEVISEPAETGSKPASQVQAKPISPLSKDTPKKTSYPAIVPTSPREEPDDKAKMSRAAFLAHQVVNSGTKLSKPRTSQGEFDIPELSNEALGIKKQVNEKAPIDAVETNSSSGTKDTTDGGNESKPPPVDMEKLNIVDDSPPSAVLDNDIADDFTVNREKYIAIYQYLPQNEDELELFQGDSVLVVEKCDDGWYVGTCERTGAFGTFPGNYVNRA